MVCTEQVVGGERCKSGVGGWRRRPAVDLGGAVAAPRSSACKISSTWLQNSQVLRGKLLECDGPKEVITHIIQLSREQKLLTIALFWWRWKDRSEIVAGERGNTEGNLLHLITGTATEFHQFCTQDRVKQPKQSQIWAALTGDELKLNVDAGSCNSSDSTGGWGFVVRNTDGEARWLRVQEHFRMRMMLFILKLQPASLVFSGQAIGAWVRFKWRRTHTEAGASYHI